MNIAPSRWLAAVALAGAASLALLSGCSDGVVQDDGGGNSSADAEPEVTLTLVTSAIEGTPNQAFQNRYLDMIEEKSDGRIAVERTEAYSLCNAQEIADCVRDGRADIGVTIPDYTPQYFPTTSLVSIPFIGNDWQAITKTLHDLHVENPDAKAIMDRNGLHHIATWPVGKLLIGSPEEVDGPEDLKGLSLRVSGPLGQQLFEGAGTNIVALPANEAYESVERGVVDGVAAGMDFPVNYGLSEILPYWTDPGLGEYSSFGMWLNKDVYDQMPDDLKAVVDEAAAEISDGEGATVFKEQAEAQCPEMLDSPTVEKLDSWDESVTAEWREEQESSLLDGWVELSTSQGLENAEGVLEDYQAGLEANKSDFEDATAACVATYENQ
ncbi:TRAP transporter substrate-binding protein [Citricoccus sp. GCM10030269]|uniref:TRAP transporter substrate-binding protein n=1 Tax=Citricoccus sp. GCM10030269 TaxID=3273388 RepID=UPI00361B7A59